MTACIFVFWAIIHPVHSHSTFLVLLLLSRSSSLYPAFSRHFEFGRSEVYVMAATETTKCLVVGAGPVGALSALYAARRGWDVEVYELRGGEEA